MLDAEFPSPIPARKDAVYYVVLSDYVTISGENNAQRQNPLTAHRRLARA